MMDNHWLNALLETILLLIIVASLYWLILSIRIRTFKESTWMLMALVCSEAALLEVMIKNSTLRLGNAALRLSNIELMFITGFFAIITYHLSNTIRFESANKPSQKSIQESIEKLSSGYYCGDRKGNPYIMNEKMNEVCMDVIGEPFTNGAYFWRKLEEKKVPEGCELTAMEQAFIAECSNGKVWLIQRKDLPIRNHMYYSLTASDITKEYMLGRELSEENEHLKQMNQKLREYNLMVDQVTREQEILNTKIFFHDNMGNLLLNSKKVLSDELHMDGAEAAVLQKEEHLRILNMWRENVHLLLAGVRKNHSDERSKLDDLTETAKMIGISIHYTGNYQFKNPELIALMKMVLHECITNTVSHADGENLYVHSEIRDRKLVIEIRNDGAVPTGPIVEGGGLSMVRKKVTHAAGFMKLEAQPEFKLTIMFDKERFANG